MALIQEIGNWNGKNSAALLSIYTKHSADTDFLPQILTLTQDVEFQVATTWILKHHLENKNKLPNDQRSQLFRLCAQLQHWEAQLHLLQSLPYLDIPTRNRRQVERFVRDRLDAENKFLRAWALNGMNELSKHFPDLNPEVEELLQTALRSQPASIKARVRKILKQREP